MKTLLLLLPLALITLAGCGSDDPADPVPEKGVVVVRVEPGTLGAGWTVTGPGDFEQSGAGDARLADRDPGDYTVVWEDVLDWLEPLGETLALAAGDSVVFTGTYQPNPFTTGTVALDPDPDVLNARWVLKIVDGDGLNDRSGLGDQTLFDVPVGPLTVDWEAIPGYATPAGFEDAYLEGGQTLTLTTTYDLIAPWPLTFVEVDAGAFVMGSPESEPGALSEEWPRHAVTLTRDFAAAVTEITVAQWDEVMVGTRDYAPVEANLPKALVTWYDAVDFCNALSVDMGYTPAYTVEGATVTWHQAADGWRLPTEAEWEYLCRAGTVTATSAGELLELGYEPDPVHAYFAWTGANAGGSARHVRSLYPNDWGLFDVHGNLGEWCWDVFDAAYYEVSPDTDPTGPVAGSRRTVRGGNYASPSQISRSASRTGYIPSQMNPAVGFRVVRTLEPGGGAAR